MSDAFNAQGPDGSADEIRTRRAYETPKLIKIELALEESLAGACKAEGVCNLPPVSSVLGGS